MPRDFLSDDNEPLAYNQSQPRDFLAEPSQQHESLSEAIVKSPFRIREDITRGIYGLAKNTPSYYDYLKQAIPNAFQTVVDHPGDAIRNLGAGIAELGQNTFNYPHDVVNYLSNRLNLIPQDINQKVQMARMPDSSEQINQTFGIPQNQGEELIRGIGRNISNPILLSSFLSGKAIKSLAAKAADSLNLTDKGIANSIIKERNRQMDVHTKLYNDLWKDANNAGIQEVPINHGLVKSNLDFIKKYKGPNQYESIETFIENPTLINAKPAVKDLKKIRDTIDEKSSRESITGAERNLRKNAVSALNNIEDNMFWNQDATLNKQLADRYHAIDYSYKDNVVPYRYNKDIQKYINRKILPSELVERLKQGEFAAKKGYLHPEINRWDRYQALGKGLGYIGGTGWILDKIYNTVSGNDNSK